MGLAEREGGSGSGLQARTEVMTVNHALVEPWISNTGSSSEVSAVVIYTTGGWTVLEEPGRVVLPNEGRTLGYTSVVRSMGEREGAVAILETSGGECVE